MKSIIVLFTAILFGYGSALSQTGGAAIPETPAGKRLSALISSYNSGDDKVLENFFSTAISEDLLKKMSAQDRVDGHRKLRKDVGTPLEPVEISLSKEFEIQAVLRSKQGKFVLYSMTTAATAPNKVIANRIDLLMGYEPKGPNTKNAASEASTVAGTWEGVAKSTTRGDIPFTMKVKADNKISGEIESPVGMLTLAEVKVDTETISMVFASPDGIKLTLSGSLKGNKMAGDFDFGGQEKGKFECTKK